MTWPITLRNPQSWRGLVLPATRGFVRASKLDNVKLFLIVLVVVGHAIEPVIGASRVLKALYDFIYVFHMPLFVGLAGHFARAELKAEDRRKLLATTLLPYLLFQLLYRALDVFTSANGTFAYQPMTPYWILWFLFSLLWWRASLPFVLHVRWAPAVVVIVALLAGATPQVSYFFSLSRTLVFFPFFLLGHLTPRAWLEKAAPVRQRVAAAIGLGCLAAAAYALAPT